MQEFQELLEIANTLNGPKGCPWDREQTFETLRNYVLEEAHELLEAVDKGDIQEMIEELGDLFYTVIFYAKVAEKNKRFTIKEIINSVKAKLIRRHPHVFGEEVANSVEDVMKTWEKVKKQEKVDRKSALDGIPKTLPSLQRAQKMLGRIQRAGVEPLKMAAEEEEELLAKTIFDIVEKASNAGIDIESAFRKLLTKQENAFKTIEDRK